MVELNLTEFNERWANKHLGETVFIIGSSCSIDQLDLDSIRKSRTIAVNGWGGTDLPFDYFVLNHTWDYLRKIKDITLQNYANLLASDKCKLVWDSYYLIENNIKLGPNTYAFKHTGRTSAGLPHSPVPATGYGTVTRCALDLAISLGFKKIYVAGFDYDDTLPYSERIISLITDRLRYKKFQNNADTPIGRKHEENWKQTIEKANRLGCEVSSISPLGRPGRPRWEWFPYNIEVIRQYQVDRPKPKVIEDVSHKLTRRQKHRLDVQSWICLELLEKPNPIVLDLGAEHGYSAWKLRHTHPDAYIIGVEIYEKIARQTQSKGWYDEIQIDDVTNYIQRTGNVDVIIAAEIIEHLKKEDGKVFLEAIKRKCDLAIVTTPIGFMRNKHKDPYQVHVCGWQPEELNKLKFRTYALLRKDNCGIYYFKR